MTFGYGTGAFEVTEERLGCYRPEEHIGMATRIPFWDISFEFVSMLCCINPIIAAST